MLGPLGGGVLRLPGNGRLYLSVGDSNPDTQATQVLQTPKVGSHGKRLLPNLSSDPLKVVRGSHRMQLESSGTQNIKA